MFIFTYFFMWFKFFFPLNNADSFLTTRKWHSFSLFEIIKRITCFSWCELCFETWAGYIFFFFSIQSVKSNCYIVFLKFFPIIFSDGKHILSQLYLFVKGLIFVIICSSFFYFFMNDSVRLLQCIENIYCLFFFFLFFFFFDDDDDDEIYCCFFLFYPVRRIYIWSTTIGIYFMTFAIQ